MANPGNIATLIKILQILLRYSPVTITTRGWVSKGPQVKSRERDPGFDSWALQVPSSDLSKEETFGKQDRAQGGEDLLKGAGSSA